MSLCDAPGLMSYEAALETVLSATHSINEIESVGLMEADGRVLASDVTSTLAVPPADNSAMDGYAIRFADWQQGKAFPVSQTLMAGDAASQPLLANTCARIMTGASMPADADTVIMQEQAVRDGDLVRFEQQPKVGANVRKQGEEIQPGDCVFEAGRRLRSTDIGLLASLGIAQVDVFLSPVVSLMTTGNELCVPGQALSDGKIYESNSYVLASMLKRLGCEVRLSGIIADELDTLRAAFQQASEQSDLVISTGGVSVGEADFVRDVLDEQGEVTLWKLAIKPGKPFAFGTLANSLFAGLPGNPVSAAVTFDQLVVPVIRKLAGERMDNDSPGRVLLTAELTQSIRHRPGRLELQRGLLARAETGQLFVTPLARQGSALLTTLSEANCYIRVPQENEGYSAGEQVEVELFEPYLGS